MELFPINCIIKERKIKNLKPYISHTEKSTTRASLKPPGKSEGENLKENSQLIYYGYIKKFKTKEKRKNTKYTLLHLWASLSIIGPYLIFNAVQPIDMGCVLFLWEAKEMDFDNFYFIFFDFAYVTQ